MAFKPINGPSKDEYIEMLTEITHELDGDIKVAIDHLQWIKLFADDPETVVTIVDSVLERLKGHLHLLGEDQ